MIYGVGFTDCKCSDKDINYKSYTVWKNILSRCYNKKDKDYKNYGSKGVTVHPSWFYYSNFKEWFDENYIEDFQIDKDIKSYGKPMYSSQSCMFVSAKENAKERASRRDYKEFSGNKNPNSKSKEYYSTKATTRQHFKTTCSRMGWDINEFKEVLAIREKKCTKFYFIYTGVYQ